MRTGTTASVRHNTTTPIPQGTYIFTAQSIYASRESLRTLLLSSRIRYEKIILKLLKRAFFQQANHCLLLHHIERPEHVLGAQSVAH